MTPPYISIRVAIFLGTSKAGNLYTVREFGNQCLLYSLDEILRYGDVLNIIQAFREAVINTFVHNKWVDGNGPMITVYQDPIEILSRG